MNTDDIEAVYDHLAKSLDTVGVENHPVLLAKLALLLARDVGDVELVFSRIDEAKANIGR